ncbi:MAG TPA: hypothetical protein VGL72_27825 [Bryobacteraceae bacterium]
MKKIVFSSVMALSLFGVSAFAEQFNAYISDSKCGAKHASDMNAKCVNGCIKGGASPVAVVGDKVYKIENADMVKDHYGHKVVITGKAEGDSIKVDTVKMAE